MARRAVACWALATALIGCKTETDGAPSDAAGAIDTVPAAAGCFSGQSQAVPACAELPYAAEACSGGQAPGVATCAWYRGRLKPAAFAQLFTCLRGLPGGAEACSVATDFKAFACYSELRKGKEMCQAPAVEIEGQPFGCTTLAAACTTNTAEQKDLSAEACNSVLDAFTTEAQREVFTCYRGSTAMLCADRLSRCTTPPL